MNIPQLIVYILGPIAGYFLGSIPFAFLIGKAHGVDIRTTGSKNVGATNLGRTLGKKYFWQAFFLDAAKGFLPTLLMAVIVPQLKGPPPQVHDGRAIALTNPDGSVTYGWDSTGIAESQRKSFPIWSPLLTGIGAMLGHLFPVWLKFKGGKGVATGFGIVLGFWPLFTLAGLIGGFTFVVILMLYRYISLASMVGSVAFALAVMTLGRWNNPYFNTYLEWDRLAPLLILGWLYSLMIFIRHRANIRRLLNGTEPQVGRREIQKSQMPPPNHPNH